MSEHELVVSNVLVPSLGGYGAQFNQHVYAPITNLPPESFDDLETAVKEFEPQLVRIFYHEDWEEPGQPRYNPGNIESFRRTVALAQEAGAAINITYHSVAGARLAPVPHMRRFADALQDLGGEVTPTSSGRRLQRAQHPRRTRNPPAVGGDLPRSARGARGAGATGRDQAHGRRPHRELGRARPRDLVRVHDDAHGRHRRRVLGARVLVVRTFNLEGAWRFQYRLRDIRKLVVDDNAPETRRPSYIMEFGVRGHNTVPGGRRSWATPITRTGRTCGRRTWQRPAALVRIAAAQLGFAGAAKFDLYWGLYDSERRQPVVLDVDPVSEGWETFPSYHALRLLLSTTERGWQVVRVEPWEQDDWDPLVRDEPEKEITAYVGATS